MLGFGLWACWRFFHLKPPLDADLHPVRLQEVLTVTEVRDSTGMNEVRAIELHASDNRVVRYGTAWPRFDGVRNRDTNLTVLVDGANQVWVVKDAGGRSFGRSYFMNRNMRTRIPAALCAVLFIPLGALMFLPALLLEYCLRRGDKLPRDGSPVSARQFTLAAGLVGYLYFFGFVITPWLTKILPGIVVALIWVLSAGALCNLILRHFQQKPRQ